MKKIIILCGIAFLSVVSSCKKDLTSLNIDPKSATSVPSVSLFTNAQRNFADYISTPSVNVNIFRLIAQQWTETTYFDESRYDLVTRNIPGGTFTILYRDVLNDLNAAKTLIAADLTAADVKANQIAIADIMQVYAYSILVNTFGNVPYSEALDINNVQPKYDDGLTITKALIVRLNTDIAALKPGAASYGGADLIYGGNVAKWIKFANTLKLKLGITIVDADAATAKTAIESASAGAFSSSADNAAFAYQSSSPNTNPIWTNLVQSGRKDYVIANTFVDKMKALGDPRIPLYFTKDAAGGYSGGIYGTSNSYSTFSKPSATLTAPDFETLFLSYSEVEFYKAEAAARGFNVGGTAATHYDSGVTASIKYWGGTDASAVTYLANPSVNYATATGTYKEKIGTQAWIAFYNRGFEAWTEWRRLDFPVLNVPPGLTYADIPLRFTYPIPEKSLNGTQYTAAASAIGGDKVSTKLFWDKF